MQIQTLTSPPFNISLKLKYPTYHPSQLQLNKDNELMKDDIIMRLSTFFSRVNQMIQKKFESEMQAKIERMNIDFYPLIISTICQDSNIVYRERIKVVAYMKFFTTMYNYYVLYNYYISSSSATTSTPVATGTPTEKVFSVHDFTRRIFQTIDLSLYHQLYEKHKRKYTLEQIQGVFETTPNIECPPDLLFYQETINVRPFRYLKSFIVIFIVYICVVITIFGLFVCYEKRMLKA